MTEKQESNEPTEPEAVKLPWYKRWWAIAGIAFFVGVTLGAGSSGSTQGTETVEASSEAIPVDTDSLRQEIESLKTERDAATAKAEEASDKAEQASDALANVQAELDAKRAAESEAEAEKAKTTFSGGVYLVGTDMPAGRYQGTPMGGNPYWQISSDPNGSNIIENSLPTGNFYIQVIAGQYLEIKGAEITLVE